MVPKARFDELLSDIEPSMTTKGNASSAHTGLRAHLRSHEEFKAKWISDFLAGSYSRDTAIRPRMTEDGQERPDVDIIVETSFATSDLPDDVLQEVADALEDGYEVERINKRSVRVAAWNAEMDVVPVIKNGDSYLIPCREEGRWKPTNPPAHNSWSTEQNAAFGGRAKKLVKLMKWWRRENPTSGKRPKGFVLEVLVAKHGPKDETHLGEAFAKTLENIYAAHGNLASMGYKPPIDDPAVAGNDILAKVTLPQWTEFLEKVRVQAEYARRAQKEEDMDEATRLWRKIFGPRFRSTDAPAKAAVASTFASGVAPAAGGYTFPNVNATPTKPRGFA
jgi:hypothetical protein